MSHDDFFSPIFDGTFLWHQFQPDDLEKLWWSTCGLHKCPVRTPFRFQGLTGWSPASFTKHPIIGTATWVGTSLKKKPSDSLKPHQNTAGTSKNLPKLSKDHPESSNIHKITSVSAWKVPNSPVEKNGHLATEENPRAAAVPVRPSPDQPMPQQSL